MYSLQYSEKTFLKLINTGEKKNLLNKGKKAP